MLNRLIVDRTSRALLQVVVMIVTIAACVLLANDSGAVRAVGAAALGLLVIAAVKLTLVGAVMIRNTSAGLTTLEAGIERSDAAIGRQGRQLDQVGGDLADADRALRQHAAALESIEAEHRTDHAANTQAIDGLTRRGAELAGQVEHATSLAARLDEVAGDLRDFAARRPADEESVALLVRRAEPAIAEVAILISEMTELREAVARLDRRAHP